MFWPKDSSPRTSFLASIVMVQNKNGIERAEESPLVKLTQYAWRVTSPKAS